MKYLMFSSEHNTIVEKMYKNAHKAAEIVPVIGSTKRAVYRFIHRLNIPLVKPKMQAVTNKQRRMIYPREEIYLVKQALKNPTESVTFLRQSAISGKLMKRQTVSKYYARSEIYPQSGREKSSPLKCKKTKRSI